MNVIQRLLRIDELLEIARDTRSLVLQLRTLVRVMKMDQAQLAAELAALTEQNEKARAEIVAKIAALEAAVVSAGTVTPEVEAALADLRASVQADDDMNPDGGGTPVP